MSIAKETLKSTVVVVLEGDAMKNGKKGVKKIKLDRIVKNASDEALKNAGNSLAALQKRALMSIQRVDVSELKEA
ncbi:hypothetical protein [Dialister micraerophilus]|jgi:hypothetical protein|uniref:DUF1659 domain-containing protein n=2 Tax=Dialister micraerophilus TaxID=309120 RepID=F2BX81_9FIRM|nr:hypothetical protein [Dialister micraerophilus]EFR42557.1 hypothetical protein HMPREF9220_0424 [Dialister micraerophilus UPII 345-E]EGF13646.1 hypothetical protein HMPREF9083_0769 [Dialister micraerophilus DSM 19965]MDK8252988.1 hypothetical protein [Dialister micraerophilus]MDK8285571.1 hypothetical protein [Dialister micraerophilus]MDU1772235.1 hypothetical protein [Dialister micraerophilus]